MNILSARSKESELSLRSIMRSYGFHSSIAFILLLMALFIVPELVSSTHATEDPDYTDMPKLSVNVHGTNSTGDCVNDDTVDANHTSGNKTVFDINFVREEAYNTTNATNNTSTRLDETFGKVDICVTVNEDDLDDAQSNSANSGYGYTLTMRSDDSLARLVHNEQALRESNYIDPITESFTYDPTDETTNLFRTTQMNRYGYTINWDGEKSATFYPVTSEQTVIRRVNTYADAIAGNALTTKVTFGVGIDSTLVSGIYSGTVILTAYANNIHNTQNRFVLTFGDGDSTTLTTKPTDLAGYDSTGDSSSVTFNLTSSTIPTLTNHTFLGYSDAPMFRYTNSDGNQVYYKWNFTTARYESTDANGTAYNTSDITYRYDTTNSTWTDSVSSITVDTTNSEAKTSIAYTTYTRTLYIVWDQPSWDGAFMATSATAVQVANDTGYDSYFKMQDMTANICADVIAATDTTAANTQTTTLIDSRDGNTYTVSKLHDGNCWMTQNLALGTSSSKVYYPNTTQLLTSDTTSVTIPASATYASTTYNSVSYEYINWSTSYNNNGSTLYAYSILNTANDTYDSTYGNYYSFGLAKAGKTSSTETSICPKGWRLPTYTSESSDYGLLLTTYGAGNFTSAPLNFVLAGKIVRNDHKVSYTEDMRGIDTSLSEQTTSSFSSLSTGSFWAGTYGFYWTNNTSSNAADPLASSYSTISDQATTYTEYRFAGTSAASANILQVTNSTASMSTLHRGNGASVRCLSNTKNNFVLNLDGNGGSAPIKTLTASTNGDTTLLTLPTTSTYIPYRSTIESTSTENGYLIRTTTSYTFLGWHTSPTVSGGYTTVSDVQDHMAYPYVSGTFSNNLYDDTLVVASSPSGNQLLANQVRLTSDNHICVNDATTGDCDSKPNVLYAIWSATTTTSVEETQTGHTGNGTVNDAPSVPASNTTPVTDEDLSTKDYAEPYGEDTIDDEVPASVLAVIKLIRALPDPTLVSSDHATQIAEVRSAYETLSSTEKAMISSELTSKYNAVLTAYYSQVEADETSNNILIAALVGAGISTVSYTTFIIVKKQKENEEEEY